MSTVTREVQNFFHILPFTQQVSKKDIIVFSHLRWEFVFQRPQHIISRLAKDRKILFIEEPIPFINGDRGSAHTIKPMPNLTVIQPHIAWETLIAELAPLIQKYTTAQRFIKPILWFYSPQFVDIVHKISHSIIVYDCMDELSAFQGAPPELVSNEKKLLTIADVVFTGGKSLYETKRKQAENVYCFPSSVERDHFAKANTDETRVPRDIYKIKKPVVGFYGVIDERIDLDLLGAIAKRMPQVSFVMIGPIVKINKADLPKLPNIHYLGGKSYAELPKYLKGIDIAMMPFALNESTKFISPTKTLEFMAAFKPIISTPIYDVVRDYKKEVYIVKNSNEFAHAIKKYLHETQLQKAHRIEQQKAVLKRTSWDQTVVGMKDQIIRVLQSKESVIPAQSVLAPLYPNASRFSVKLTP